MHHLSELKTELAPFYKRAKLRRGLRWSLLATIIFATVLIVATAVSLLQQKMLGIQPFVLCLAGLGVSVLGFGLGWFWRVKEVDLAKELDRITGSKDRLLTSMTLDPSHPLYGSVVEESRERMSGFDAKKVVSVRQNRLWWLTSALVVACVGLQFVNIKGLTLSPKAKAERIEVVKKGEEIERLTLEKLRSSGQIPQSVQAQAAQQLKLSRDLKSGSKSKEEAMRETDRIATEAIKQEKKTFEDAEKNADTARSALERVAERRAIQEAKNWMKANQENAKSNPSDPKSGEKNNPQGQESGKNSEGNQGQKANHGADGQPPKPEKIPLKGETGQNQNESLDDLKKQAEQQQKKAEELQKQMDSGKDSSGNQMSEQQKQDLQKKLDQAKKESNEASELSKQAEEFMKKLQSDPDMQKMMQDATKLAQEAQRMQNGETPQMSKEELEKMAKELGEMAEKFKDQQDLKQLAEQLKESAEQMQEGQVSQEMRQMMQQAMGASGESGGENGTSQNGSGQNGSNKGENDMAGTGNGPNGQRGKGGVGGGGSMDGQTNRSSNSNNNDPRIKTVPTKVDGQRRKGEGKEYYQEFFGPSLTGERSKMPYAKQLPNYTKQAETALNNQKISARHRKRVKNYFDTLSGRSSSEKATKP